MSDDLNYEGGELVWVDEVLEQLSVKESNYFFNYLQSLDFVLGINSRLENEKYSREKILGDLHNFDPILLRLLEGSLLLEVLLLLLGSLGHRRFAVLRLLARLFQLFRYERIKKSNSFVYQRIIIRIVLSAFS